MFIQNCMNLEPHTNLFVSTYVCDVVSKWLANQKIAGSMPTVVKQTFQLARCEHTQRQHQKHISSPDCITPEIEKIVSTCSRAVLKFIQFHTKTNRTNLSTMNDNESYSKHTCSGIASPTIWSCYANFKPLSLLISLEIDCFHGLWTRKYLHSMTKLSGWLRHWLLVNIAWMIKPKWLQVRCVNVASNPSVFIQYLLVIFSEDFLSSWIYTY